MYFIILKLIATGDFLAALECTKFVWGSLQRSHRLPGWFKGPYIFLRGGKGRRREGKERGRGRGKRGKWRGGMGGNGGRRKVERPLPSIPACAPAIRLHHNKASCSTIASNLVLATRRHRRKL